MAWNGSIRSHSRLVLRETRVEVFDGLVLQDIDNQCEALL